MPVADAVLVRRARGGDRDAFAALIARHHATLLACCRRMVGQHARDAAQDAVLTAMLSLDRLRDESKFGSWLVGIGLNACRALLRDRPLALSADGLAPDPADLVAVREVARLVRAAIGELPRGQREAVTLYYLAGLSQAEAAAHLGIPPGAVKTRLHKARANLRTRLRPLEREHAMVQMQVDDVRRAGGKHIIMLAGGGRELKIWVGEPEAQQLAIALENVELPRPTSYDLTAALLQAGGTAVREVRVSRLVEHTFYGEVVLADGSAVDARPSDAINLALVTGAPILVDESVLVEAETIDPEWADEHAAADASTEDRRVLADEVRERLSRP
ncbi:MAG TPA: bifunctional nuclease domain-containing protein [Solirubrobacteraceae bacterium]|nr:bifunctional nuclease domain-containing protein [Solirubrobacteraceae bacterium]